MLGIGRGAVGPAQPRGPQGPQGPQHQQQLPSNRSVLFVNIPLTTAFKVYDQSQFVYRCALPC